jgi:YHS domain-containing protein
MLLEDLLWLILSAVVVRAIWHVIDRAMGGMSGQSRRPDQGPRRGGNVPEQNMPKQGVQMVRDPVCGTYVVPSSALVVADGSRQVFFCSTTCRDKYRARTA